MQRMVVFYETLYKGRSASLSAGAVCHIINKLCDCSRWELYGTLCRMITKNSDRDGIYTPLFTLQATNCSSSPSSAWLENTKLILPNIHPHALIAWEPLSSKCQDVMCPSSETNPEGHVDPLKCPVVNDNCTHWVLHFNNYDLAVWFFIVRGVSS